MTYRAPSYLHGKAKNSDHPCLRCDNFTDCADDGKTCDALKRYGESNGLGAGKLTRFCHDCGTFLPYHNWIEVRCTLDNEDVTQAYCWKCYVKRSRNYVLAQEFLEASQKAGSKVTRRD
jgi:hypothetical protein